MTGLIYMANHIKPTTEELEKNIQKSLEALEDLEEKPVVEVKEEEEKVVEPEPSEEVVEEVKEKPEKKEEEVVEPAPSEEVPEKKPLPPAEERLKESTRESQVLFLKNRKIQEAIEQAGQLPEPTEDELKVEFSDWDELSPVEQKLAKDNLWNKRKFDAIATVSQEGKDIDAWNNKVDEFVDDPKTLVNNPELEGKVESFKSFAMKPSRRGLDLPDLVLAFNGELIKNRPEPKKGQMFPTGSAGPNEKPKENNGILSLEQGNALRETNYKLWKEKLMTGKIANE